MKTLIVSLTLLVPAAQALTEKSPICPPGKVIGVDIGIGHEVTVGLTARSAGALTVEEVAELLAVVDERCQQLGLGRVLAVGADRREDTLYIWDAVCVGGPIVNNGKKVPNV